MSSPNNHNYNPCCGRCFTYPQGHISFFPSIWAVAAVLAAFSAIPFGPFDGWNHAYYFICVQYEYHYRRVLGDDYSSSSNNLSHECFPLQLLSETYWNDEGDDMWAWPIQLASMIAIVTLILGGLATIMLLSATCFKLPAQYLLKIGIVHLVCVPLSILTLIAGAVNICKKNVPNADDCKRVGAGIHLQDGATLELFAALCYLVAGISVLNYRRTILDMNDGEEQTLPLRHDDVETQPLQPPVTNKTVEHTNDGHTKTTEETIFPDGTKMVQVISD